VRRELGVRTLFNILGPLTNPARAPNILMGVFHPDLVGIQVRVLQRLGVARAMVVWGGDGLDEITLGSFTKVGELRDGEIREYEIEPARFGFAAVDKSVLRVASAEESKARVLEALDNRAGAARDIVALNSAAALYVAGCAASVEEGLDQARKSLASGAARRCLEDFIRTTRELKDG
jgi:anthranilate phosphoribosyltransferase